MSGLRQVYSLKWMRFEKGEGHLNDGCSLYSRKRSLNKFIRRYSVNDFEVQNSQNSIIIGGPHIAYVSPSLYKSIVKRESEFNEGLRMNQKDLENCLESEDIMLFNVDKLNRPGRLSLKMGEKFN